MKETWVKKHKLAYILIASPILGFTFYFYIGQPAKIPAYVVFFATILAGLASYKFLKSPLMDKIDAHIDKLFDKLRKRLGLNSES